jgi:transketolase C-terminal domain/subunit
MALPSLRQKWEAFGWNAYDVDGHDIRALVDAVRQAPRGDGKPVAVVAHTVKGKGVSFMEDDNNWHYRIPNEEEVQKALRSSVNYEKRLCFRMTNMASEDKRIVLLSGDIGNRLFDDYKGHAPDRFVNCGIAEANMIGVASGMAMCGLRPIAYTITPFITARCYEQIKVDVCYHNLPVIIVGVGGGLSYAELLSTHHSCDDIALLRILPNMTVICPSDSHEVRAALRAAVAHGGPVYIRLGKKNEPLIHDSQPEFTIGKGIVIREGTDVCMLSTGNLMPLALETAAMFGDDGISAGS